jgi:hypothetical protein
LDASALPRGWQDLVWALVVKHLVAEKKSPGHAANNVARPTRCLATCCWPKEPWEITAEDLREALDILAAVSAKLSENAETVARWMSAERLAHAHPLIGPRKRGRAAFRPSRASDIRHNLDERKRLNRLPGEQAFWELVRIALDERPASFYDDLRLRACLIQILMGLRVGEIATLPADTLHARDLTTAQGGRPFRVGGHDRILSLRHFSEKQAGADARGIVWAEKATSVITLFESVIEQTVSDILARTAPLRERLRVQHETGRIFPELDPNQPLGIADLYPRVTGNPVACLDHQVDPSRQSRTPRERRPRPPAPAPGRGRSAQPAAGRLASRHAERRRRAGRHPGLAEVLRRPPPSAGEPRLNGRAARERPADPARCR